MRQRFSQQGGARCVCVHMESGEQGMMWSKQFVKVYFTKAVVPPWGRMRLLWLSVNQIKGEKKARGNKRALQEEVPFAFASATRSLPKNACEGLAALWACPGCVAHLQQQPQPLLVGLKGSTGEMTARGG